MKNHVNLFLKVQNLGFEDSQDFPKKITQMMVSHYNLSACSFYTIDSNRNCLILRGQFGFKYKDYHSFALPLNSCAGQAYQHGEISVCRDISVMEKFHEKSFIINYNLSKVISVPLYSKDADSNESSYEGVLNIYPGKETDDDLFDLLDELQTAVSISYQHSVEHSKSLIKDFIEDAISRSNDLNSSLHRSLIALKEEMNIEGASIFIFDDRLRLLKLHATTGIESNKPLHKNDVFYSGKDKFTLTWQAYLNSKFISVLLSEKHDEVFREKTNSKNRSMLLIPIVKKNGNQNNKTIGVLRVTNKLLVHENKHEHITFSVEDTKILKYACEIISMAVHMFMNKENKVAFVEKIMHGTRSNIVTSLQNLDLIERRVDVAKFFPNDLLFTMNDTKEWLSDIKNQMDRLNYLNQMSLTIEDVSLAQGVLKIIRKYFLSSAMASDIQSYNFTKLFDEGFYEIPKVKGDIKALITVFRNLAENSIKYRNYRNNNCVVKLRYEVDEEFVRIYFLDQGIGVPEGDEANIFEEGFRSVNGIRQEPSSTGLGLTQSRELMKHMGGDLQLNSPSPTEFVVTIKRSQAK